MKAKLSLCAAAGLLLACAGTLRAQQTFTLDEVIVQAGKAVEAKLKPGSNLAVLAFTSPSAVFSDYVIEELTGVLVMNGKLSVIERRSLDLVRKEMDLQLSGDVSDDSALSIGKQVGAQGIVTGSLQNMGNAYRFRVKVINVETARIEAQVSYNLRSDDHTVFLLNGSTSPGIGRGKENTRLLIEYLKKNSTQKNSTRTGIPAQACAELEFGGYQDWFWPSSGELNLMYRNLKENQLGGFSNSYYWSSSESNSGSAWLQSFESGGQADSHNDGKYLVRAVRAF